MPAKLDRCVQHLKDQGKETGPAFAICTASLKKKLILLNKEKIKEKSEEHARNIEERLRVNIEENIMAGSAAPIAAASPSNGKPSLLLTEIYKSKEYRPAIKNKDK